MRRRPVEVSPGFVVTVLELAEPRHLVERWMDGPSTVIDPFGVVLWPGARLAARLMHEQRDFLRGKTVLAFGAGTGLEALVAAHLGAVRVVATDVNPLSLSLLEDAARLAGLASIETVQACTYHLVSF